METRNAKTEPITKIYMKTKRLGNSDLSITPVGFGAWAIGGSGWQFAWGPQDDKESIAAIYRALELGANWIDTAAVYGLGHSEEVVARALAEWPGPRPYVFTKCGLRKDGSGKISEVLKADSIRRECEESLRVYAWKRLIFIRSIGQLRILRNLKRDGRRWHGSREKAKCAG
jgi:aryl-alcohol dehydrogenase-like predicted oxidoreductase